MVRQTPEPYLRDIALGFDLTLSLPGNPIIGGPPPAVYRRPWALPINNETRLTHFYGIDWLIDPYVVGLSLSLSSRAQETPHRSSDRRP